MEKRIEVSVLPGTYLVVLRGKTLYEGPSRKKAQEVLEASPGAVLLLDVSPKEER